MKIYFVSLGCDKNRVDSEKMLGLMLEKGYELTDDEYAADIAVVNTCSFILDAKDESISTILELADLKNEGSLKSLIVTGCLAQRYHSDIKEEIPEVDAVLGTNSYDDIINAIENAPGDKIYESVKELKGFPDIPPRSRYLLPPYHYAYLKIAEGCNKNCTYCAIPAMRGGYRSVPEEDLVKEAEFLASNGVKELILVAQETTLYGVDIYGRKSLPDLINRLSKIPEIEWIRILYAYPEEITDKLIETIADNGKVCKYIDMPIQHTDDEILKRMGRRTDRAGIESLIKKLRSRIPDITIRTTLISGFPGETDAQHKAQLDFIRENRLDRVGVFSYSPEEGTKAAEFPGQIEDDIKDARRDEILEAQQEISLSINEDTVGDIISVINEGYLPDDDIYAGRSQKDAPDVDGYVFYKSVKNLMSGDISRVLITKASEYDLYGEEIK